MNSKQKLLEKLLKEEEDDKLEFKQKINDKNKISKTIASFANNKGGVILIGIRDDKSLINIDPEEERYMITEAAEHYCRPPVGLSFMEIEDEETNNIVLAVLIKESLQKPHFSKVNENDWRVYIRQNDKSVLASDLNISLMKKGINSEEVNPQLSEIEQQILNFLKINKRITVKQFMNLKNISKRRAQRILTGLVLTGILKLNDYEKENFYTM
jgi:predicted HTH transcriptional regulator